MIHVEQLFDIRAPRHEVWEFLADMNRTVACLSGVESIESLADERYKLRLAVKIGPIKVRFDGEVTFVEKSPPERMRVEMAGKDTITGSKIRMSASVEVNDSDAGVVTVVGKATVDVFGSLSKYGQGVADKKAAEITAEFAEKMRAQMECAPRDASSVR